MNYKLKHDITFAGVAMGLIIFGATIFAIGLACWVISCTSGEAFSWPGAKIMGGTVIMALGYIVLQLELIRRK